MPQPLIQNVYHKKSAGIILAKRVLSPEEMDKIFEDHITKEKQRVEDRIRKGSGFIIHYTGK